MIKITTGIPIFIQLFLALKAEEESPRDLDVPPSEN